MHPGPLARLLEINRQFYDEFGSSFASTRRRIQPGVRRILAELPEDGRWLDLGCGSGALAVERARQGARGMYLGVDFSQPMLEEANRVVGAISDHPLEIRFLTIDFTRPELFPSFSKDLFPDPFDGVLMFAALHHVPSANLRLSVLSWVHSILKPAGIFVHSEWQFQHSPRLWERRLPWDTVGLLADDLEAGDTLLDWRHNLAGESQHRGLRYVHLFSAQELTGLAAACGFEITGEFESDGEGGRLSIYQVWQKTLDSSSKEI